MPIYRFEQHCPVIDDSAYVHPSAEIIGDVIIEAHCYIAPGAVLRGDFGRIHVQHHSNIQDNCVLHSFPNKHCHVHPYGHVGHAAVLHGCTLMKNVLIGMNAVVMDEAVIGENSIIAANSFVAAKFKCPEDSLVMGMPAKIKRTLSPDEIAWKSQGTDEYVQLSSRYLNSLQEVERKDLSAAASERQNTEEAYKYKP